MTRARTAKQGKRTTPQTAAETAVSAIMSRDVVTVRSGTSLESVIELMLARGLSRMPVVDDRQRPVGIISKTDVVEESHDRDDLEELTGREDQERGFHLHRQAAA
ncbi:MAG TPA: CBS domain-containing protein, partial [Myxococcales bacterium]